MIFTSSNISRCIASSTVSPTSIKPAKVLYIFPGKFLLCASNSLSLSVTKTNNNLKKSKPKQPKKNLNPTASKVKEEDNKKEKIIKSAKEWGMASNDPRNKN